MLFETKVQGVVSSVASLNDVPLETIFTGTVIGGNEVSRYTGVFIKTGTPGLDGVSWVVVGLNVPANTGSSDPDYQPMVVFTSCRKLENYRPVKKATIELEF